MKATTKKQETKKESWQPMKKETRHQSSVYPIQGCQADGTYSSYHRATTAPAQKPPKDKKERKLAIKKERKKVIKSGKKKTKEMNGKKDGKNELQSCSE